MKQLKFLGIFLVLMAGVSGGCAWAQSGTAKGAQICGTYKVPSPNSDDTVTIRVEQTADGSFFGKIIGSNRPTNADGSVRTDVNNPDPSKRSRTLGGMAMCWGLKYDGKMWGKGHLYNPNNGKTYDMRCKPISGSRDLDARYYVGVPSFGVSVRWIYIGK